MNVLLLGGGGREHALASAIAASPECARLVVAPGNAGTASWAENRSIDPCDAGQVQTLAREIGADLVVIGPEAPLAAGVSDALREIGLPVFGPSRAAARLETSKAFAKELCAEAGAPTAAWARFRSAEEALAHIDTREVPIVVKADGLAAGKGVVVAETREEAREAVTGMLAGRFGAAGSELVIEEFLAGEEASFFALCAGRAAIPFAGAQDHKRAFDGDQGPNTGGMGAYSPAPMLTPEIEGRVMDAVVLPCLDAMARRGTPYHGVLYVGLMIEAGRPQVVEFNARFGDPECQTMFARLRGGALALLVAAAEGSLEDLRPDWDPRIALTVVLATRGYPGAYASGSEIGGIAEAAALKDVIVDHAGTARADGRIVAAGGRVLNITGLGRTLREARERAYAGVAAIEWPEGFWRTDIGARGPDG